ncbi:gluconate 5-dehydrogenase [Rodentibacter pneumotropicus]|uniref:Gluconate 5-dehydrogenase n=1 Tax=Rodentibacter pneumotropicus TaxID=758 RepID=A0A448MRS9_9PAST|nr:gluconate 5-dehydrogenase [Rodentibacter pneumotropicus]
MTNTAEVHTAIDYIEQNIGPIDVLINNAGIQRRYPFCEFPEQDFDDIIQVNQKAVLLFHKLLLGIWYGVKRENC